MIERVFSIFKELNQIPRPSHQEYERDKENCVVIRKRHDSRQGHSEVCLPGGSNWYIGNRDW